MGKKAKYKQLRQVANELPVIMLNTCEKHIVKGSELIEQEITTLDNVKVDPEGTYMQRMPVMMAINHKRRLKKMFNRHGANGVFGYIGAVEAHMKKQNSIQPI